MKVGIAAADPADAILTHQDRGAHVVEQIPAYVRQLPDDLCQYRPMARRRHEQIESRRLKSAERNAQDGPGSHGDADARAWVVTRRNS